MHKILLIDKGNSSIHNFQEILEDKGFSLIKVQTLKEAFSYLKNTSIDLIVVDKHGHLVGSKILAEIGQLLSGNLRSVDIITRYGGDEFVIILPQTPVTAGFQIAERLRKAVEQYVFLKHEGYSIKITAGLGVASYPDNAKSKEELFRIADEAMYRGKFSTKNTVYAAAK